MLQMFRLTSDLKLCQEIWGTYLHGQRTYIHFHYFVFFFVYGAWMGLSCLFIIPGTSLTVIIKLFFLNIFLFTKFKRNCFFYLLWFDWNTSYCENADRWVLQKEQCHTFLFWGKCLWRVGFHCCEINCSDVTEQNCSEQTELRSFKQYKMYT